MQVTCAAAATMFCLCGDSAYLSPGMSSFCGRHGSTGLWHRIESVSNGASIKSPVCGHGLRGLRRSKPFDG
eukprot:scaffold227255_cov32-Tisochrysis_lutea.AAC.1